MFRKIISARHFFYLVLGIYLFINFSSFLWVLIAPEGILSIIWYSILLFILIAVFVLLWNFYDDMIMARKTSRRYRQVFDLLFLSMLGSMIYFGPILFAYWSIQDRYKLINRSELYFDEGRINDAINLADNLYTNSYYESEMVHPFFFMQYLYENSSVYNFKRYNQRYLAATNLAYCIQKKGDDLNRAEALFEESYDIAKNIFIYDSRYQLFPLLGSFKIYMARGENELVERTYYKISTILSDLNKYDVKYKVQSLIFYSDFIEQNGDFEKAIGLRSEALSLYQSIFEDSKTGFYKRLLIRVASDYLVINNFIEAEKILAHCEKLLKRDKRKTVYRDFLYVEARLQEMQNNFFGAEQNILLAKNLIRKTPGVSKMEIIKNSYSLASLYLRNHNYLRAQELFDETLIYINTSEIEDRSLYRNMLLESALSDFEIGKVESFLKKAQQIERELKNQFDEVFLFLPEEEKEGYVSNFEKQLSTLNFVRASIADSINLCRLYDNILSTKAIALESNRFIKDFFSKDDKSALNRKYNDLMKRKEKLYGKRFSESQVYTRSEFFLKNAVTLNQLRSEEINLLRSFVNETHYDHYKVTNLNWSDVRKQLKEGELAIEFINVPIDHAHPEKRRYFALIVTQDCTVPKIVKLFDESELTSLLKIEGKMQEQINTLYSGESFQKLYNLIWDPIKKYLGGSDKVYVSKSGILHEVSFPILTLNEKYDVEILSSTRNLLSNSNNGNNNFVSSGAILYGDIDYDYKKDSAIKEESKSKETDSFNGLILRKRFGSLPDTRTEIINIASILEKKEIPLRFRTDSSATEESFRLLYQVRPAILHVATHGFYYKPKQSINLTDYEFGNDFLYNSPLYRSGLLFAGANQEDTVSELNDGILTSYEISKLDLRGVNLVVLSACETGLGDIKGGEGVYGLQRAFKLAGVESMIVSLWKVPDKETSILMELFYENHYVNEYTKQESLRRALKFMREQKKLGPYYWGAFEIIE